MNTETKQNPKPILVVSVLKSTEAQNINIRKKLQDRMPDYHVIVHTKHSKKAEDEIEFKIIS